MAKISKVFKNGRSQAIRIPKEYRVETKEVFIEKSGDLLIIRPKYSDKWDSFFEELEKIDTSDFMTKREQLPLQKRKIL